MARGADEPGYLFVEAVKEGDGVEGGFGTSEYDHFFDIWRGERRYVGGEIFGVNNRWRRIFTLGCESW